MVQETPHDFQDEYEFMTSSKKKVRLSYWQIREINQGGPLIGNVTTQAEEKLIQLEGEYGGPPFQTNSEDYLLVPKWKRNLLGSIDGQEITIIDLKRRMVKNWPRRFRLLQFEAEILGKLMVSDSPGHAPEIIEIDLKTLTA